MSSVIDPETMPIDELPGVWTPVQWELTPAQRQAELEEQARASLLWGVNPPEAILRLLLDACAVERTLEPPPGYDPEQQGEWDSQLVTFAFRRPIRLLEFNREPDRLYAEYALDGHGQWAVEIAPEEVTIRRLA